MPSAPLLYALPCPALLASQPTSGMMSGTPSVIRKAELLSTTMVPAAAAMGPNFLLMEPPALNRAMSTSLKLQNGTKVAGE